MNVSRDCATTDHAEDIVSISTELAKLRIDYDEAEKEIIALKAENSKLHLFGTQRETDLVGRLLRRLRKYEPDIK